MRKKAQKSTRLIIDSSELIDLLQTSQKELSKLTLGNKFPAKQGRVERGESYYDVHDVIKYLWKNNVQSENEIDKHIKQEKLRGLEIKHNNEEGLYVTKVKAAERMETLLRAIMNMFYYAVKRASPMLAGCRSPADAEKIQMLNYETIFQELEKRVDLKEWAEE